MTSLRSELLPHLVHKQFSRSKAEIGKSGDKPLEDEIDMKNPKGLFVKKESCVVNAHNSFLDSLYQLALNYCFDITAWLL